MTGIEELREALRAKPADPYAAPDLPRIVATGRRLRRRRQVLQGAGVAAVVAVVVLALGLTWQLRPGPPLLPVAGPVPATSTTTCAAGGCNPQTPPGGKPSDPLKRTPLGAVVPTGLRDSMGEIVLYVVAIDSPALPNVHFGLMAGHRTASGELVAGLMANEFKVADRTPGFRVLDGGRSEAGPFLPVFGYYVGPAAKITTTVGGRTVQAGQVSWSEDPNVVIFWFAPEDVPSNAVLTPPRAYSAGGDLLPR